VQLDGGVRRPREGRVPEAVPDQTGEAEPGDQVVPRGHASPSSWIEQSNAPPESRVSRGALAFWSSVLIPRSSRDSESRTRTWAP
jgi:hypothetical protein